MPPQPSSDEPAEELLVSATARSMVDAVSYLIEVADQAGLDSISRGLARVRAKLLVIGGEHDRDQHNESQAPARRRKHRSH
jgi:hypothetical protein